MAATQGEPELERALGPGAITVYAVGDVLGAGIYALVGAVVGLAHEAAWLSFLVAAVVASLTGLTYAELSSRFPLAAGAAAYCRRAFPHPLIAFLVGIFVLTSGVTSAATVSRAFVGYLEPFVELPELPAALALIAAMGLLNFIGIRESARVNLVLTIVEVSGLLLVIGAGLWAGTRPAAAGRVEFPGDVEGVLAGATVAFFAYIGFEDTVNVAEEVRDPSRSLPRAILAAIGVSCVLYAAVTIAALLAVPEARLAASGAPLLEVIGAAGLPIPAWAFSLVALFAITNTGLLNLIMASRLSYGMARERLLPAALGHVHAGRHTPSVAIGVTVLLAALLACVGGARVLAQTTSLLLLVVFTVAHVALLRVKRSAPDPGPQAFRAPSWTPAVGALVCVGLMLRYPAVSYGLATLVLLVGLVLYRLLGRAALEGPGGAAESS